MNKNPAYILAALLIILFVGLFIFSNTIEESKTDNTTISIAPTQGLNATTTKTTPVPTASASTTRVKMALVALDTNGPVGCGDSIEFVNRDIPATQEVLRAALNQLLSLKTQYFGQSGLYNALYASNLSIDRLSITSGVASVYLVGTVSLGGTCDSPRFKAQLEQTALQFPTVKSVQVFINGRTIDEVLSQK